MKSAATHSGTCQVCGRNHKVNNVTGKLAKHGYVVAGGMFHGQCPASEALPLEVERTIADEQVKALEEHHAKLTKILANFNPKRLPLTSFVSDYRESLEAKDVKVTFEELVERKMKKSTNDLPIDIVRLHVKSDWNGVKKNEYYKLKRSIEQLDTFIKDLKKRIDTVHGEPLTPVEKPKKTYEHYSYEDRGKAYDRQKELKAQGIKSIVRGRGRDERTLTIYGS